MLYQSIKRWRGNRHKYFQHRQKLLTEYQPLTPDGCLLTAESGAQRNALTADR